MLYLEDLAPGQVYTSDSYLVTTDAVKDFAGQWDPQPFHLDEAAAQDSFFGKLAASGWHTAAITMRLLVTSPFKPAGGFIGAGVDLKWLRPVYPGDQLTVRCQVLEARPMRSKPGMGMVQVRVDTLDAAGEAVQTFTSPVMVQQRLQGS